MTDPRADHAGRLAIRRRELRQLDDVSRRVSVARMLVFLIFVAMLWPVVMSKTLSPWWVVLPTAVFALLMVYHERIIVRRRRVRRAVTYYEEGIARLDHRWAGAGNRGAAFADASHSYTADLDVFGTGSLFELLCRARTRAGKRTLASWLCDPAAPAEILMRQEAVAELARAADLRESVFVLADEVSEDDDPDALVAWATTEPQLAGSWPAIVAPLLGLTNYVLIGAWFVTPAARWPALAALATSAGFAWWFRSRAVRVLHAAERPERELELLAGVMTRLESERFEVAALRTVSASLDHDGRPASRRVAALARLVQIRDSRENKIFMPFAALALVGTQLAFALERWRTRCGPVVPRWIEAVGRFEALASLASIRFERPDDTFPEIDTERPSVVAEQLGHPLLAGNVCVRNDVRIDTDRRLLLVSGSNMSGKSTLLRSIGVNVVLALAGGTVRARRMRVSPLQVGACMRVHDSLLDGTSQFYAEIRRLRQMVELASHGGPPLLFLLDEILHGTNSDDRRAGADALIRGLLERGALGLVTTHDLALAEIAAKLEPQATNVHFEDRLEGDRIVFDYRLRAGVVERGNALALMRAVGLEV